MTTATATPTTTTPTATPSEPSNSTPSSSATSQPTQTSQGATSQPSNEPASTPTPAPAASPAPTPGEPPKAAAPTQATPEEEYEIELAEDSPLSEEELNEIAEEAGRLRLSKADAQKLVAAREKSYKNGLSKAEAQRQEHYTKLRQQIESDPEFSGEKKAASFQSINRAVETFGDPELVELLKTPDIGNNIVIARFLKRLGDAMGPDNMPGKGTATPQVDSKTDTARRLYPSFFEQK